jgi:hypothetical protein
MAVLSIDMLYKQYIKPMSPTQKLQVVERIAQEMTQEMSETATSRRTWSEIRGAASYPPTGEDAQQWVSRSRRIYFFKTISDALTTDE